MHILTKKRRRCLCTQDPFHLFCKSDSYHYSWAVIKWEKGVFVRKCSSFFINNERIQKFCIYISNFIMFIGIYIFFQEIWYSSNMFFLCNLNFARSSKGIGFFHCWIVIFKKFCHLFSGLFYLFCFYLIIFIW